MNEYNQLGQPEGYWEFYFNGKLRHKGTYKNGIREGYWEFYFNGKLKRKGTYNNGRKVGLWETYHKTGILKTKEMFI